MFANALKIQNTFELISLSSLEVLPTLEPKVRMKYFEWVRAVIDGVTKKTCSKLISKSSKTGNTAKPKLSNTRIISKWQLIYTKRCKSFCKKLGSCKKKASSFHMMREIPFYCFRERGIEEDASINFSLLRCGAVHISKRDHQNVKTILKFDFKCFCFY